MPVNKKALHVQGFSYGCAVLFFPRLQAAMVAALGFDQFTRVRVVVNLDDAGTALFGCGSDGSAGLARVRIQDGDDVAQAFAVGLHQPLQLFFEFDFFLQTSIVLQGFQLGKLLLKGFFCCAKFGDDKPRALRRLNESGLPANSAQAGKIVVVNQS
eukprot:gene12733-14943_t